MMKLNRSIACLAIYTALQTQAFAPHAATPRHSNILPSTTLYSTAESGEIYVEATPIYSTVTHPEAIRLREELRELSLETSKGFQSSSAQKQRARDIINDLAKYNPTPEPAVPYYENYNTTSSDSPSLKGKWDLIYTDAPDIISLDTSWNPLATAKLGRIGQECDPPFIKNVIEWKKPEWADQVPLPFAGNKDSRILQKVCTRASANPSQPKKVDLKLAGIELVAPPGVGTKDWQQDIEQEGLPVGLLRNNPLELRGPLTAPFGQFEVLYLDEEMRIVRTSQNYLAVNVRSQEEWF